MLVIINDRIVVRIYMKTDLMRNVWEAVDALRGSYSTAQRYKLVLAIAYVKRIMVAEGQRLDAYFSEGLVRKMVEVAEGIPDKCVSEFICDILASSLEIGVADSISVSAGLLPNDVDELSEVITKTPLNSMGSMSEDMPEGLIDLVLEILDGDADSVIVDLRARTGDFLVRAAQSKNYKALFGCCGEGISTINKWPFDDKDNGAIARMRLSIADPSCEIKQESMFEIDEVFDRAFVRTLFGCLLEKDSNREELRLLGFSENEVPPFRSEDWLIALCLAKRLAEDGRGVALLSPGSAFWVSERRIRRYFIAQGLVEAIIELPPALFSYTKVPVLLLVLSRSNDRVRMVDASRVCEQGRRVNTLSPENISLILSVLRGEEGIGVTVENDRLLESDCILTPSSYTRKADEVPDGVALGSIIASIRRGANVKAAELEQLHSSEATQFRCLMLSNVEDGEVSADLPYLADVSEPMRKCLAETGDLVVSKIGPKYKAAVIKAEGEKILCTGNLFIITVDKDKYDPRFLQMFLQSEAGQAQLSLYGSGTIPSVSMKDLRKIVVPGILLDEQKRLADERDLLMEQISYHREAIEKSRHEIEDLVKSVL